MSDDLRPSPFRRAWFIGAWHLRRLGFIWPVGYGWDDRHNTVVYIIVPLVGQLNVTVGGDKTGPAHVWAAFGPVAGPMTPVYGKVVDGCRWCSRLMSGDE